MPVSYTHLDVYKRQALTGYVYLNLKTNDYGGYVNRAEQLLHQKLALPAGYTWHWAGEYEFELRAKQRLKMILPIVFFVIFMLLYLVFKSATEAAVLIFPTLYAMSGGLLLQWLLGFNFSVAVWVGYIALFGIAVETGVVMVVYLHEAFQAHIAKGMLTVSYTHLACDAFTNHCMVRAQPLPRFHGSHSAGGRGCVVRAACAPRCPSRH